MSKASSTAKWALLGMAWLVVVALRTSRSLLWNILEPEPTATNRYLFATITDQEASSFSSLASLQRVVFVHIGKAGGETIKRILDVGCQTMMNRRRKARCQSGLPASQLSTVTVGYFHCFSVYPQTNILNTTDAFLYNIRHPVDRILSWYRYVHPGNCNRHNSPSCIAKEKLSDPDSFVNRFYACFPTFYDWVESLNQTSPCGILGRRTLAGKVEAEKLAPEAAHATANYQYYYNETAQLYSKPRILLVRTEHLWDDLSHLDSQLGGNGTFGNRHATKISHGSEQFRDMAPLSIHSVSRLCCSLWGELHVYQEILLRASNLNRRQKTTTWNEALARCGWAAQDWATQDSCQDSAVIKRIE